MNRDKFILMAGPCVIESEENTLRLAESISNIVKGHNIDFYLYSL